jgi:signal transduction histidine kinase
MLLTLLLFNLSIAATPDPDKCAQNFVAAVGHDLRNPISAAHLAATRLLQTTDPVMRQTLTVRIINNLERVNRMIIDLLDATRIDTGQGISMDVQECKDLKCVFQTIIEDLETVYGARFILDADPGIGGHWCVTGIRRAVENLLINAVKYGNAITPIVLKLRTEGDSIRISVNNRGDLLTPQEISRITTKHERLEKHAERAPGWGIGLTVVSGIAHGHHGYIDVESTHERGTTFSLVLPMDAR